VCRFRVATGWRRASKYRKRRPYWSVTKLASITFWSLGFSWTDKPWFLTEGKFVTVLIIPSSWGSQLDGEITSTPCRIRLRRRWSSTVPTAKRPRIAPHLGRRRGCRRHPTGEAAETPSEAPRRGQKPQQGWAGADQATGARSTGRRAEAMATNGGETDESPRSNGRAWRRGAYAPHGDGVARRNQATKSSVILSRQREESD
jgi:hypothetical protein